MRLEANPILPIHPTVQGQVHCFAPELATERTTAATTRKFSSWAAAFSFLISLWAGAQFAHAASCTTQAQMEPALRTTLANSARSIFSQIRSGNLQALRNETAPAVAANFNAIANSIQHLRPLVEPATITVDNLYLLDASTESPGAAQTAFYCGSPVVTFQFNRLPPGTYALAILHATGVPHPQQVSLIESKSPDNRWMLAGFFDKPMMSDGHDGLWYWKTARQYARQKKNWDAWLYYGIAVDLLDPLNALSSPNLQKLHGEADQIRPASFPRERSMTLTVHGTTFAVDAIATTTALGPLDLDVRYDPDAAQAAQLRNPMTARQQVTEIMSALLELHPELRNAFHGIWVHAQQGSATLFALELPMQTIAAAPPPPASESVPARH